MAVIYYFSGTGNSIRVAEILAEKLNGKMIPLAPEVSKGVVRPDDDIIGIVCPVYGGDLPLIVRDFLGNLSGIENKYIFAAIHYGGGLGVSHFSARKILKNRGGRLSALLSVHMPQNAFYKSFEKTEKILASAEDLAGSAAKYIARKKRGVFSSSRAADFIQLAVHPIARPLYKRAFLKISGLGKGGNYNEAVRLADRTLTAGTECTGCGICAKVCPVGNIKIEDGRPIWLHRCENCLACHNWCPQKTVTGEIGKKDFFYTHPRISLKEMFRQAGNR